jgi:hypothetical protein
MLNKSVYSFVIFTTLVCAIFAGQILPVMQNHLLLDLPHLDITMNGKMTVGFSLTDMDLVAGNYIAVAKLSE